MDFVYDTFLQSLYDSAVRSAEEHDAVSFWSYAFQRYFHEQHYFYDTQKPASQQDPRRRVDGTMTYMEKNTIKPMVLFFHEAKKAGQTDSQVQDVEGQAFEACGTYLQFNSQLTHVYAVTTIGTEARFWKYSLDGPQNLIDSQPSGTRNAYIDAKSTNSKQLVDGINHMKQFPPSAFATAAPIAPIAPTAPTPTPPTWTWSEEHQDHWLFVPSTKTYLWAKSKS